MVFYFDHFHKAVIRQGAGNHEAAFGELLTVIVVELIAMAMTFRNVCRTVSCEGMRTFTQGAGVGTKAHRAALVFDALLGFHEVDNGVLRFCIEFGAVCVRHAADVAGKFDNGALHA